MSIISSFFSGLASDVRTAFKALASNKGKRDLYRQLALLLVACLAIIPLWDVAQVVFFMVGVLAILGMAAHILRLIFFPNISMDSLYEGCDTAASKAAVFVSLVIFLCTIFYVGALLVKQ